MRISITATTIGLLVAASLAIAQRQGPGRDDGPRARRT